MENSTNEDNSMLFRRFMDKIKEKKQYCIIGVVLGAIIGFVFALIYVPALYSANAKLYLKGSSTTIGGYNISFSNYVSNDYQEIFLSRPSLEKTIENLNLDMSPSELKSTLNIECIEDTIIMQVECTTTDPKLAADIANSVMHVGEDQVKDMFSRTGYVIEEAVENNRQINMSKTEISVIGAVAGLGVSLFMIFVLFALDDKIKSEEEAEVYIGLPVLSVIPDDTLLDQGIQETKKMRKKESK